VSRNRSEIERLFPEMLAERLFDNYIVVIRSSTW